MFFEFQYKEIRITLGIEIAALIGISQIIRLVAFICE